MHGIVQAIESILSCSGGEMVDTGDLKSPGRNPVLVRLQSRALFIIKYLHQSVIPNRTSYFLKLRKFYALGQTKAA